MRKIMLMATVGTLLLGCESDPAPTTAADAASVHALRAAQERCVANGAKPGSGEMIACMRADAAAQPSG